MSRVPPPPGAPPPLRWADWPAPARVRAVTTLRRGAGIGCSLPPFDDFNLGDRCEDDPVAVAANRRTLQTLLRLPAAPNWLRQVHGRDVHLPDLRAASDLASEANGDGPAGGPAEAPPADAAVTGVPGTVLTILSADCLPVLLCAMDGSEVAAAHAGWRGLAAGVLEATLSAMRTPPDRLHAWLGPAAGASVYEVGAEVRDAFLDSDPDAAVAFVATRPGHWLCDLPQLASRRLRAAGTSSIHGGNLCTISDPQRFFSHRRDRVSGRMASLVWIEPQPDPTELESPELQRPRA